MDINKRKFTGSCIPLATPLGKILMNCKESKLISKSIREIFKKDKITIKLSQETIDYINKLKNE